MKKESQKIMVGLSGGVDSAIAAYLLKKDGWDVHAVFMKNFSEKVGPNLACPWKEDRIEAYKVASFLDIPITTWNFEKEYHARVVDYMVEEYQRGRTPNPDIMCNKEIKFKTFLERARRSGAHFIATGHYARVKHGRDGVSHLYKGLDPLKDQSYFLSALTQNQLQHVIFPLGGFRKTQIRALARRIGLPNAARPDSQGICFIGKVDMKTFLKTKIKPRRGEIVNTQGEVLGHHEGVFYYTVGQRRGINIGGGAPLYVIDKDSKQNRLIVGTSNELELFRSTCVVTDWHWISKPEPFPLRANVKIRYRQNDQVAILRQKSKQRLEVFFAKPQRAVSPGQTVAAYKGQELIGSGVIV